MDQNRLKKLTEYPEFISDIYHYCDRWCERCSFTSRCMNFVLSKECFEDPETHDINSKVFWNRLNEFLSIAYDILKETAEENGIDLDSFDAGTVMKDERIKKKAAESHPCSLSSTKYIEMVDTWLDSAESIMMRRKDEPLLNIQSDLLVSDYAMPKNRTDLKETVQIIRWYQHQIYVKIKRAIHSRLDERDQIFDNSPNDSDGSAKVALIAIDRSMDAWTEMSQYFKELEIDILKILVHLDELRGSIEETFPNARQFVRPGFDTINQYPVPGHS